MTPYHVRFDSGDGMSLFADSEADAKSKAMERRIKPHSSVVSVQEVSDHPLYIIRACDVTVVCPFESVQQWVAEFIGRGGVPSVTEYKEAV